jgi:hypothetical protein
LDKPLKGSKERTSEEDLVFLYGPLFGEGDDGRSIVFTWLRPKYHTREELTKEI